MATAGEIRLDSLLEASEVQLLQAGDLAWANGSYARSESGGPRQRESASRGSPASQGAEALQVELALFQA